MTLAEKLKEYCHQRHLQVRAGEYASYIMEHTLSVSQYKTLLIANLLFHSKLEMLIDQNLPNSWKEKLEWTARIKSTFAEQDLLEITNNAHALILNFKSEVPGISFQINNQHEAIGALYVIEGTAIGGAIIRKNLQKIDWVKKSEISPRFYGCYGKTLSEKWKSFISFLKESDINHQYALNKAYESFMLYEDLLRKAESISRETALLKRHQLTKAS